ncbi:MAG: efflux RND transporter periplasmic adaptor subunit [Planctomycetes bacterium]|nr:efflux RND transporter periplasmic adaptor subunit [Planctomycetota bacterium]
MSAEVDIKQLAIVRDEDAPLKHRRRHLVSRYLVPGSLVIGFASLMAWASRDMLAPPHDVWVVPVLASQSTVQSEGTPLFQAAGWIESRPTPIRVAALAPSVVERLLVVEDQLVKAGEPIAELVKQDAQLAYDRAMASLELREAEVDEMKAGLAAAKTRLEQPVHLRAALSEADAALAEVTTQQKNLPFATRRAEAELEFAIGNYERKRAAGNAVSGRDLNEAKSARDVAQALVEELRNRADSLAKQESALTQRRDALATQLDLLADEQQAKGEYEAKCRAANARVEQARVALAEAKLRLERMTVRAPVDGRVYQLVAYPGTTLTGGMGLVPNADGSTVVTLYQPNMMQVRVDARFEDIPKVTLGQPVRINNPALAAPIAGKVLFVSSVANIQKNTLQVKVAIDSPASVLKPEMLVDVTFLAPKAADQVAHSPEDIRLYLPQQVIQQGEDGPFVWLADMSDRVARRTPVATGSSATGGLVEVSGAGLTVASRVIARGYDNLGDGDRIRVVTEDNGSSATAPQPKEHAPMSRLPHQGE